MKDNRLRSMDGKRSLLIHVKHFEHLIKKSGVSFTTLSQADQSILIKTRLNCRIHSGLPFYITLSNGVFGGKTITVSYTTVLPHIVNPQGSIDQLAAFLNQFSALIPHLAFQLDLDTKKILIRQQFICSSGHLPDLDLYKASIQLIAPELYEPVLRLTQQHFSVEEARSMADSLSDACYEVIDL